ncbi:MAG: hypothetical protein ACSLFM_01810 [Tepidiformaceae bacterium]
MNSHQQSSIRPGRFDGTSEPDARQGFAPGTSEPADLRDRAVESAEAARERAADAAHNVSEGIRERSEGSPEAVAAIGTRAADSLDRTANYLRDRDSAQIWDDVEAYTREHPVQAVLAAVAAGFIISRVVR